MLPGLHTHCPKNNPKLGGKNWFKTRGLFFLSRPFCHITLSLFHFLSSLSVSLISPAVFYLLTLSLPLFAASILIAHVFASAALAYWSLAKTHTQACIHTHPHIHGCPVAISTHWKTIALSCRPTLPHTLFIHAHVHTRTRDTRDTHQDTYFLHIPSACVE